MLARIRNAKEENESGFTLIELLVVMIIIGILAAIAIPAFLSQRAKARDTSTKADVSTAGKEIATFYVDGSATLAATQAGGAGTPVTLTDGATTPYSTTVKVSKGAELQTSTAGFTASPTSLTWCVGMTNAEGSTRDWMFAAAEGLTPVPAEWARPEGTVMSTTVPSAPSRRLSRSTCDRAARRPTGPLDRRLKRMRAHAEEQATAPPRPGGLSATGGRARCDPACTGCPLDCGTAKTTALPSSNC